MEGGDFAWSYRDVGGALHFGHLNKRLRTGFGDSDQVTTPKYGEGSGITWSVREKEKTRQAMQGAQVTSFARRRTGRLRKRNAYKVFKSVIGTGDEVIYRWQQTSRTYIGPGRMFLGAREIANNLVRVPIHFLSLTNHDKGNPIDAKGAYTNVMCRILYNKSNGDFAFDNSLVSQQRDGNDAANQQWQYEKDSSNTGTGNQWARRIFHKYSDIKINLYGTYAVPITYRVMLCTMKEQVDPLSFSPIGASGTISEGTECANMLKDWSRKLMHNTVGNNNGKPTWPGDVRIIKEYVTTIQPLDYSNQNDLSLLGAQGQSTTPHIRELKWFVRHDRFRDYQWCRNADNTLETRDFNAAGWDLNVQSVPLKDVEWGKRVFLFIMASSPTVQPLGTTDINYQTQADTGLQGSYDICIRNSFVYFT